MSFSRTAVFSADLSGVLFSPFRCFQSCRDGREVCLQPRQAPFPENHGQLIFNRQDGGLRGGSERKPPAGEADDAMPSVGTRGFAGQVAQRLQLVQQMIERLLRQAYMAGQLGRAHPLRAGEPEQLQVRCPQVVEASRMQPLEQDPMRGLGRQPQQRADSRLGEPGMQIR